ncbi:MAG TPA: NADH-quinone oxidoreductase subunit NuoF [Anaerolineae bacterium]|nr:NADH-quinone oxidoreductase subunit NuoF [Anaerolineae bacterium]
MPSKPTRQIQPDPLVEAAVAEHGPDIVSVFHAVQSERGYLSADAIGAAAQALTLPDERAFGIASFYSMFATQPRARKIIRVCDSPACRLAGSQSVRAAMEAAASGDGWAVERTSCLGLCDRAPAALVNAEPCGPLTPERAAHALSGWRGDLPAYADALPGEVRVTLARVGQIDPDSIDSALAAGAYRALRKALDGAPSDVVDVVEASGLQGRGGAGFPVGRKWKFVAQTDSPQKVIVCNFDESEPGTFKDRVLVDGDPHLLLEGIALAGYAVGASEGFIYIRGEYEWIARRLEQAIEQAERRGWLGENIQDGGFSFKLHVHRGAGAYICGEETALLEALEGRRGEPRVRPPYPTTQGYLGQPTVVNNVESFCTVPSILLRGAEWYKSMGTPNSPGVKLFGVFGHVRRPRVFEAPYGITLREIIDRFGGGMRDGAAFKMALTGGAAGMIAPASLLDVPLDFASGRQGLALGSGAMFVLDESVSAATLLHWILHFFESESCGKCTPCREGTRETRIILERVVNGQGRARDVDELKRLAHMLRVASFCGLGQSAAMPIESGLKHFGNEFRMNDER